MLIGAYIVSFDIFLVFIGVFGPPGVYFLFIVKLFFVVRGVVLLF